MEPQRGVDAAPVTGGLEYPMTNQRPQQIPPRVRTPQKPRLRVAETQRELHRGQHQRIGKPTHAERRAGGETEEEAEAHLGEQGGRGAEGAGGIKPFSLAPLLPCSPAPFLELTNP